MNKQKRCVCRRVEHWGHAGAGENHDENQRTEMPDEGQYNARNSLERERGWHQLSFEQRKGPETKEDDRRMVNDKL